MVAGAATISSTQTATSATMNINQTSQRAVINWDSFSVGKNATVNFNQPNSQAVTLNRVTSANASIVEGVIRANGRVMLVNPNGVNFGKGAEVHAAGVVASTLDISNKDFMDGKMTFTGNGQGKIVNEGKIVATDPNGYIALLAPEVRNQGYLIARKGTGSTIAMAAGEKITLDFRGSQLIGVTVDKATYNGLIENKRVVEVNGGLVILAAGTARELMASLISNTGRISANAIVDNGGVIDIVASNVNQAGTITANGNGASSTGGQINIVGENITLAANSKTTATGQAGGGSVQVGVGRTVAANANPATSSTANGSANSSNASQTAAQILASNPQAANLQAKTVTIEDGAIVNASAITQGNGGAIVIWSQVKTVVNGVLSAIGGYLGGNGGFIETSSAGSVVLGKNLSVNTGAPKGSSGLWFLDPIDLTIDSSAANVISAALTNNNVSITVAGNICPTLGNCTQNGTGSLTIASGANILKESGNLTTLTLTSSGIFNLNADISGQNLNVIINSSIAYLNVGTSINANQVTVQAQSVYSYGTINAGSASNLGNAIQLLANAIYVSGGLRVGSNPATSSNSNTSSNTISYNGTLIRQQDLPDFLATANQTSVNLDQVYSAIAANQSSFIPAGVNQITLTGTQSITIAATAQLLANGTFGGSIIASAPQINLLAPSQNSTPIAQGSGSLIQANGNNGPGGIIALTAANDFNINSVTISANGSTDGGSIRLISMAGNLLLSNSLIQTNGGSGRGGSLGVSAANDTTINSSTLEATGFTKGGSIMVGYDSAGKSIPFSQSTTIDAATILSANQTDGTNSTDGGLIETSGGTLTQLASINAGRGGMWLLDPYNYDVSGNSAITTTLDNGSSVTIDVSSACFGNSICGTNDYPNIGAINIIGAINATNYSPNATLTFRASSIRVAADVTTNGSNQVYQGDVLIIGQRTLNTQGGSLTIAGNISGAAAASSTSVLALNIDGSYSVAVAPQTPLTIAAGPTTVMNGNAVLGVLQYFGNGSYAWTPSLTSAGGTLVVGGGGGGGANIGGGGGGGAVLEDRFTTFLANVTYSINIGAGGNTGASGGQSSIADQNRILTITANGGQGGPSGGLYGNRGGANGIGYGGGAPGNAPGTYCVGSTICGAGGGGGAQQMGGDAYPTQSGAGGWGIDGTIYAGRYGYGGGGGSGSYQIAQGWVVSVGAGGARDGRPTDAGMPNTGGGGSNGAAGGSGFVALFAGSDGNAPTLQIFTYSGAVTLNNVNANAAYYSNLGSLSINSSNTGNKIQGNISGNVVISFRGDGSTPNGQAPTQAGLNPTGKLLLSGTTNDYTNQTTVFSGTLIAGSSSAFGHSGMTVSAMNAESTIDLNGQTLPEYTINLSGSGVNANGALINSNITSTASFRGAINGAGSAYYFGGPGAMDLANVVVTSGSYGIGFVNGATVSATNLNNAISLIAGSNTGSVNVTSTSLMSVGTIGSLIGFNSTADIGLVVTHGGLNIANNMTAGGLIRLFGQSDPNNGGQLAGVNIGDSTRVTSLLSLVILGNGQNDGNGVMIGSGAYLKGGGVSIGGFAGSNYAFGNTNSLGKIGVNIVGGLSSTSPTVIDGSLDSVVISGYSSGPANVGVGGINITGYTLLLAGSDVRLAASTPNANLVIGSGSGNAVKLLDTVVSAGGNFVISGSTPTNTAIVDNQVGNQLYLPTASEVPGTAVISGNQFGINLGVSSSSGAATVTDSQNRTFSGIIAGGNIWMAAQSGGGIYAYHPISLSASLLSNGGSINIIGVAAGNQAIGIYLSNSASIRTINSTYGNIIFSGSSSSTASGIGIYLDTGVVVDAAANLTLVGRATGSYGGGVFGIASKNYGGTLLKSGADMVLAASAPNATNGTTSLMSTGGAAIDIHTVIYAGRDLIIYGAQNGTLTNQNGTTGTSIGNAALVDSVNPAQSSVVGVAIENYGGVSYGNSSYVNTVAGRNISINASGHDIGMYIGGSITSVGGSININGTTTGSGTGVMVQVTYSEPKQIITQSAAYGDILITGTSTETTSGTGIYLWSNGPNPIGINSAKSLTLVGWAAGTGTNYAIRTSGYGTLISAGYMTLAGSAPNSETGTAILSTYNISAGGDLTIEGSTRDGGANYHANAEHRSSGVSLSIAGAVGSYNGVSSASNMYIYGASVTTAIGNLTASDGHSRNYAVDVGHANLQANGAITIQGTGLSLGPNGGTGESGNVAIVVGNINSGGLLTLTGNSPDYSVFGGMTITSAGGIVINGTGYLDLRGSWSNTGSSNTGVVMAVTKDVNFDSLRNSGGNGIRITAGNGLLAGNGSGWTIGRIGSITNTGGVIGLSMAAPSSNAYGVEALLGITPSNASTAQNISYNKASGDFSTPNGYSTSYTNGNFINYRQAFSATYNVTVNNNYSAVYGTTTTSDYARNWFGTNSNVSLSIVGTAFGVNQQAALQSLRFNDVNNGGANLNIAQNATPIAQGTIFSIDGTTVNVATNTKTYTITPAPLGISVTGVYNNSTTFAPSSFTTYGLVNGEVINTLSSATVAFKDVLAGNNYVTGIVIGTGTASMSNYQLNPLGRVTTPNSTLQNMATITPREVQVTGASAANKVYDGTTTAVVNIGTTINGKISGDDLTVTMTSGSFMSPGVGTGISVSGAGSLQGASASNYTLGATLLMANITKAPLGVTVTGTYSGSTTITPTSFTTNGLVNGETITTLTSAIVNSKDVAANSSNYVTAITKGNGTAALSNYEITASRNASTGNTQNTATIDPKTLTVSSTAVADKVYDGTATATLTGGTLSGVNPGESVTLTQAGTFSRAGVGTSLTVTAADTISDTSGNYTLQQPQTLTASITPKSLTVSGTIFNNKVYDGTNSASLTGGTLVGVIAGDSSSVTLNASGSFIGANVGNGIAVVPNDTITGSAAGNYTLIQPVISTANITPAPLGVSVSGTYNGSNFFNNPSFGTSGLVHGETINSLSYVQFSSPNVSANGSNYITSLTIGSGTANLSNYSVTASYNGSAGTNQMNYVTLTPKSLTLSGAVGYAKTYDGTNVASINPGTLVGIINSDNVSIQSNAGTFASANAGNNLTITPNMTLGGSAAGNYTLTQPTGLTANIIPAQLGITATAVYNGGTFFLNPTSFTVNGLVNNETITQLSSVTLSNANVSGNGSNYVFSAVILSGTASISNYRLNSGYNITIGVTQNTATVTPAPLTVTSTSVASKVYDGTNVATLTGGTLVGVVSGDIANVGLVQAGIFAQSNVGNAIAVTASNTLTGTKATNYTLTQPTGLGADITPKPLGITVTGTYNGTNTIEVTSFTTTGLVAGEVMGSILSATLSDANVATPNKYVGSIAYITGNGIRPLWMSNYSISQAYNATVGSTQNIATITPVALTVTGTTVPNKVYDGTTTTTLAGGVLVGVVGNEVVNLIQSGTFASPNAGNNVAVVANDSLSGNAAVLSNYTLVQPTTTTGNITRAPVTVTGTTVSNKVYDGTVAATLTNGVLVGVIAGDVNNVTLNQSGTFANANVGNTIAVTASDTLTGAKAANYILTQPTVSAANITPAPLGVSITNAVYQASTSLYPVGLNFTFTGLVNGETITALSSATVANQNVSANGSNYVTALTVGAGTASLSNYSLNSSYSANVNNVQNKVTLTPMAITVTGTTVPDKVYDGTTTTTLAGGHLVGVFANDSGQVSLNQSGTFASPNAGNNVAVVANDSLNLTGSAIGNYTLVQPTTTTGNIIKAPLGITVSGTYTGSTSLQASGINFTVNGLLNGETINTLGSVTVYDKNVSANVNNFVTAITVGSGTASMNNYALTQAYNATAGNTQNTATIATTQLTVTGTALTTKVYDGTPAATLSGGTLVGIKGSDTVFLNQVGTFSDSNVGNGLTITAADTISGAAAVNYTLVQPTGLTGNITPKSLTVNGTTVPTKVYDGTTATTLSGGYLVGLVGGDVITLTQAGTFASANAGTGINVVANDSISGPGASNYTLIQPTTATGNITKAPLGVTVTGVYNGATLVPTAFTTTGLQAGETITALSSATAYSPNVSAAGNYVTAISIGGGTASMNNYALNQQYNTASGNTQNTVTITPKAITLTGSKVYDGVTNGNTVVIGGLVGNQTLAYSGATTNDANVGSNRYITAITLSDGTNGGLASNYVLPSLSAASASNTATITPKVVSLAATKIYDATTGLAGAVTITTGVGNETLTYTGATANNANVSANGNNYINAITLANATDGSGGLASNYILPLLTAYSASNAVTINPKAISISATKTYDATAILTGSVTLGGLVGSQTLTYIGATAHTANAGSTYIDAITITDGGNGGLASNYQQPTLTNAYTNNNVTITPKVVTLSANKVYDGTTNLAGAVTIGGLVGNQTLTYTNAASIDANVATTYKHIITITLADGGNGGIATNYALPTSLDSYSAPVTITPKALTVTSVTANNKVYDATTSATFSNAANLVGVVGSDNVLLTQTGSFASKNVGTGIAVTANDSISGTSASNYTLVQPTGITANITPAPLGVTVTGVYSGSTTITPTSFTTTGLQGGDTITSLSSANLSYPNVVNNGNMPTYVTAVTIGGGSATMSNYQITQAYSATVGNAQNIATITPKALTLTATKVYDGATYTYDGMSYGLTGGSVTFGGLIGSETLNYFAVGFSDANVATPNKYITAISLASGANNGLNSNYSLPSLSAASASNSATITPKTVSLVGNKTYDGTTSLTGAVTITGLVGSETLGYTGATANSANVLGTNFINAIALTNGNNGGVASNYQLPTLTNAYTDNNVNITAKPITISGNKVYDATTDLTGAVTITGLVGNQTLSYTGATANSANVLGASYINSITFSDGANGGLASNYALPTLTGVNAYNGATVTPAPLSLSGTKVYDGTTAGGNGNLTISGLIGAQTITYSNVTINDANVGSNKFVTAITLADGSNDGVASNYALPSLTAASARNNGSITPKDLFITVSAQTKTYGDGIAQTSNTQDGIVSLTPITGHLSGTASNTDTRVATISDIQYVNYTGTIANNASAGFSVNGLVANDTVNTVNITSTGGALNANASVNGVNTYAINASGAVGTGLSNYNINYVTNNYSVMTITPRKLTVSVANATMTYGANALPNFSTTQVLNVFNNEQVVVALTAKDISGNAVKVYSGGVPGSPVNTYDIVATGVNNPNYVINQATSTPGQLTITPANLTITANSLGGPGSPILYGTPTVLKPDAFTAVGLTNGDSLDTATITFNGATTISGSVTPGTYAPVAVQGVPGTTGGLQISGASGPLFSSSNYVINYVAGTLTIGQARLTVTAVNDAKLQGQSDVAGYNGVIVSGFVNGDTMSVLSMGGLSITRNNAVNDTAPGTYNNVLVAQGVALSGSNGSNYSIAYQTGNYTIVPPGQLLVRVGTPAPTEYGTAIYVGPAYTGASPTAVVASYIPTLGSAVQYLNANISQVGSSYVVNLSDASSNSANVPLVIGTAANISGSNNISVGSYNLSVTPQQLGSTALSSLINPGSNNAASVVTVGGVSVMPKVLTFGSLGTISLNKVYDGKASSTVPVPTLSSTFFAGDNVAATANGTFTNALTGLPDANVGINKSYTIAVTFAAQQNNTRASDANNYVLSGGGIYTADGVSGANHGPANGEITRLDSVTYIGAASGGAWSSASSWTNGAVPTYSNVARVIVPVNTSVVYDSGVAGPVSANLENAGNVNFNTDSTLSISMNISGAGSITISGNGSVSLSGNNTYTGNSIISNGSTLIAVSGNSIGAGNIQGQGGTFQGTPGAIFNQINASGSLRLASDITTTGNQTYGNLVVTQARTTLLSQNGNILINGTLDGSITNGNTLLVQAPTGTVSLRGSSGSIMPINVLEVDAVSTYLYADVLTSDQQNYCGAGGCYYALTLPQITANYCATNDCYSKNNITSAYNLLASGTGGSGDFAKNTNIGQIFIGDNGQVGFLFNSYTSYATQAFGAPAPLFQNNPVYARTLISRDPMVNFSGTVNDASAASVHTLQAAAIQVPGVTTAPLIQLNGSGNTQSLFSLNALTQSIAATNTMSGSIKNAADSILRTLVNINLGSNSVNLNNVTVITPTLNVVVPPATSGGVFTANGANITVNNVTVNGRATSAIAGARITAYTPVATGSTSRATPTAPTFSAASRAATRVMATATQQTKLDRKYDVEASVDIGDIETDDGAANDADEKDPKKKKRKAS